MSYVAYQTIGYDSMGVISFVYTRPIIVVTIPQEDPDDHDDSGDNDGEDDDKDDDTDDQDDEEEIIVPDCYYNDRTTNEIYLDYYIESGNAIQLELFQAFCTPSDFQHIIFYNVTAYSEYGYLLDSVLYGTYESIDWYFEIRDLDEG